MNKTTLPVARTAHCIITREKAGEGFGYWKELQSHFTKVFFSIYLKFKKNYQQQGEDKVFILNSFPRDASQNLYLQKEDKHAQQGGLPHNPFKLFPPADSKAQCGVGET